MRRKGQLHRRHLLPLPVQRLETRSTCCSLAERDCTMDCRRSWMRRKDQLRRRCRQLLLLPARRLETRLICCCRPQTTSEKGSRRPSEMKTKSPLRRTRASQL